MAPSTRIRESFRVRLLILLVTAGIITYFFPKGEAIESEVAEGTIWVKNDLIAPYKVPVPKNKQQLEDEFKKLQASVFPIYRKLDNGANTAQDSLRKFISYLSSVFETDKNTPGFENPTFLSAGTYGILKQMFTGQITTLTPEKLADILVQQQKTAYLQGIISKGKSERFDTIALRKGNTDIILPVNRFLTPELCLSRTSAELERIIKSPEQIKAITELYAVFLFPDYVYDETATKDETALLKERITRYKYIISENERIVAKHERITPEIKERLDAYRAVKAEKQGEGSLWLQITGKFLHTLSLLTLLGIYFAFFRKRIYNDNLKLLVFAIIILWTGFVSVVVQNISPNPALQLLVFIPAATMLLTIMFDSRVGFYSTIIISFLCGGLWGNDYAFVVMNVVAGALAGYSVRDIKNRTQLFKSFVSILIGYSVTILAFGLERFSGWEQIGMAVPLAATNALISPALTYGLLIFFERLFKITTELTLLELTNFERPLLRELALRAPGSFNHSVTMGTMVEAAANEIGANPMLARVGAYYHDIGKTLLPRYFVENQKEKNLHDELKPEESVKVILEHVTRGMELAREHKVPEEIVDFIPMHHGTMPMIFFYEKAKKLYGEENVKIEDYSYPGPLPNTKETALVMLADSCESAVRSVEDSDPDKVENLIHNLVKSRVEAGQLNNSPLTLKDIQIIINTFVNVLLGQRHKRLRYPGQEKLEQG